MNDFKEDLLDALAIFRMRLNNIAFPKTLIIFLVVLLWPIFYFLMAFTTIKLIFSCLAASSLVYLFLDQNSN